MLGMAAEMSGRPVAGARSQSVRDELRRILASRAFQRSERLRNFLRFIVERWLEEPAVSLKEYSIGTEVYGRPQSFDPRCDSIIRVEARRLRAKLAEYYNGAGREDPIEISVPSGTYVPVIRARPRAAVMPDAAKLIAVKRIVVEPCSRVGNGADLDEFRRGLTEEVVHALDLQGICVLARHAVRGIDAPPPRADAVLEGMARRIGAEVRVTARLMRAADHMVLWSDVYTRPVADHFATEQELAASIARAIKQRCGDDGARAPESEPLRAYMRAISNSER